MSGPIKHAQTGSEDPIGASGNNEEADKKNIHSLSFSHEYLIFSLCASFYSSISNVLFLDSMAVPQLLQLDYCDVCDKKIVYCGHFKEAIGQS